MTFAAEHAAALDDIEEFGAAVTFKATRTSTDPSTGQVTTETTEVEGHAMRVKGDPVRYQSLGVVESDAATLLFAAATYGNEVRPGMTVVWTSRKYTVDASDPVGPDGPPIISRVVVSR